MDKMQNDLEITTHVARHMCAKAQTDLASQKRRYQDNTEIPPEKKRALCAVLSSAEKTLLETRKLLKLIYKL